MSQATGPVNRLHMRKRKEEEKNPLWPGGTKGSRSQRVGVKHHRTPERERE